MRAIVLTVSLFSGALQAGPIGLADLQYLNQASIVAVEGANSVTAWSPPTAAPLRLGAQVSPGVSGRVRADGFRVSESTRAPIDPASRVNGKPPVAGAHARGDSLLTFRPEHDRLLVKLDFHLAGGVADAWLYDETAGKPLFRDFGISTGPDGLPSAKGSKSWKFDVEPSHRYSLELFLESNQNFWDASTKSRLEAHVSSYIRSVPEPGSLLLVASGIGLLGLLRLRGSRSGASPR